MNEPMFNLTQESENQTDPQDPSSPRRSRNRGKLDQRLPGRPTTMRMLMATMMPPTVMEMWATMGSALASFMFIWAIIRQYCPYELRRYFDKYSHRLTSCFYPYSNWTNR